MKTVLAYLFHTMKYLISVLSIFVTSIASIGQNFDNYWIMGYNSQSSDTTWGGTVLDFNFSPPYIHYQYTDMNFSETNASMCNTDGNLLFYTNGIYVANSNHVPMLNGLMLNPGQTANDYSEIGYILPQSIFALPHPIGNELYYLFHMDFVYSTTMLKTHSPHLYYSVVDMKLHDGLGKLVQKNKVVLTDTLNFGKLTCTRHGNGRDWWMVVHELGSSEYYRLLVTPWGIQNLGKSSTLYDIPADGLGQGCFSPDGNYFARINTISLAAGQYVDIYKFDRCSGLLFDQVQVHYDEDAYTAGLAISPNSRFLYVSSFLNVYQFDLWADDIAASKVKVAEWDGFMDGNIATLFYLSQLAPDGKIYINSISSPRYLHVINQPNLPYPDCDVQQHGVYLPTRNSSSLPNFPNYRLGPWDGSPCDSLGINNHPVAKFRYDQDTLNYRSISFTDLSYYQPNIWNWNFGDGTSSSEVNPEHEYTTDGAYEVCLTVANQNGINTYCRTLYLGVSASNEELPAANLTVFPNPALDAANFILSDYLPKHAVLYLHTATGQLVHQQRMNYGWNLVPLDGLAPGLYFYKVQDEGKVLQAGKLVKVE